MTNTVFKNDTPARGFFPNFCPTEFDDGRQAAHKDIVNGDIYDIKSAIESFDYDPPDSPRQRGYLYQLKRTGR